MNDKTAGDGNTRTSAIPAVLNDPMRDRGVAFTAAEREALGLTGRLPAAVLTLEQQARRVYRQLQAQGNDLAKNVYLEQLHDRNEVLYYRVLADHLAELLPIVYDPTVGDAIEKYSHEYRRPRGVFLSIDRPDEIKKAFGTLGLGPEDVDLIVVHRRGGDPRYRRLGRRRHPDQRGQAGRLHCRGGASIRGRVIAASAGCAAPTMRGCSTTRCIWGTGTRRVRRRPTTTSSRCTCDGGRVAVPGSALHFEDFGPGNARRILGRQPEAAIGSSTTSAGAPGLRQCAGLVIAR